MGEFEGPIHLLEVKQEKAYVHYSTGFGQPGSEMPYELIGAHRNK
jgi:hypothetical protein